MGFDAPLVRHRWHMTGLELLVYLSAVACLAAGLAGYPVALLGLPGYFVVAFAMRDRK